MFRISNKSKINIVETLPTGTEYVRCSDMTKIGPEEVIVLNGEDLSLLMKNVFDEKKLDIRAGVYARILLHDLKNYLTVINVTFNFIKKLTENNITKENAIMFDRCNRSIVNLNDLSSEYSSLILEDYSKKPQKANLKKIINKLELIFIEDIKAYEIDLSVDVPTSLFVFVNDIQFLQCLVNLFKNAVEHIKLMGDSWIRISYIDYELCISNKGQLAKECDIDKIFDRNYSTNVGLSDARGLGLSFVKECLESQNIKIQLTGKDCVCFSLKFSEELISGHTAE